MAAGVAVAMLVLRGFFGGCRGTDAAQVTFGHSFFMPVVIVPAGNGHAYGFFDVAQVFLFLLRAEGDSATFGTSAGGAADAVHVGLWLVWEIEVDHQSHVFHIDTTRGNIGGH